MDERKRPEKPLSPEIVKLTDKLVKDPKSRFFVPLAEEYLKAGLPDEAVIVLTDGLKIHPNLHAARTILGKVYLEKGEMARAKTEFEQVVKADPENLLAHRKLAKLYKDAGQADKARISCQAVLSLNPKDAEMRSIIEELNRIESAERQMAEAGETPSTAPSSIKMSVEQTAYAEPERGREPEASEPIVSGAPSVSIEAADASSAPHEPEPASPVLVETPVGPAAGVAQTQVPSMEEAPAASSPVEEITSEALADLYIEQGHYEKGIAIYRRLLAKDPENPALFKKLDETVKLIRLLSEGPQIKPKLKPVAETAAPASFPSPVASNTAAYPDEPLGVETPSPAADRDRQRIQKIQRLQAWLDSIKKGQNR
ncbi:MAG: tetratricopeptide repeat protein [Nitrospirae bacterium]|nr:tetratricopeptide repeat protein [Nitrospirota bacterium]